MKMYFQKSALLLALIFVLTFNNTSIKGSVESRPLQFIWRKAFEECLRVSMEVATLDTNEEIVIQRVKDKVTSIAPNKFEGMLNENETKDDFHWTKALAQCMRISKALATLDSNEKLVIKRFKEEPTLTKQNKTALQQFRENTTKGYMVVLVVANWFEAFLRCKKMGLRMATVESEEDQQKLQKLLTSFDYYSVPYSYGAWLGGSDLAVKGQYKWMSTGELITYTAWREGEPSCTEADGTVENCILVGLQQYSNHTWNDYDCFKTARYTICDNGPSSPPDETQ